jgi:DNA-binding NarL/FixJ family response regulator
MSSPTGAPSRRQVTRLQNEILIVDDHKLARTTVRELLHWHDFEICGEAASDNEALEKVRELKPGIVLLDINMPEKNGIQTAYEIRQIAPSTKIVFLTVHKSPDVANATRAISHGFVSKSAAGTELIPTLNRLTGRTEPPGRSAKARGRN